MDEVHLFLDTNVLLHYEALDGIRWRECLGAKKVILHIAPSVLEEIAVKKDMGEPKSLRKRAGRIAKRLLEYLEKSNPFTLRDGEVLLLDAENPRMDDFPKLNAQSKDDQLIASALSFQRNTSIPCRIVTGDSSLTLRVKAKQWELEHLAAPESGRLPDELDAGERESAALRQELAEIKRAQPRLELSFYNGEKLLRLSGKTMDVGARVRELSAAERKENPRLKVPSVSRNLFSVQIGDGTPAEIEAYNDKLEQYFREYERWAAECIRACQKSVELRLRVTNSGVLPAESVHVKLHFPDGFKLVPTDQLDHELPAPPAKPRKPGIDFSALSVLNAESSLLLARAGAHAVSARPSLSIKKTNSYDVEWEHDKVRQNTFEPLDDMTALFENEVESFEFTYELRADNLREVVKGTLRVFAASASEDC